MSSQGSRSGGSRRSARLTPSAGNTPAKVSKTPDKADRSSSSVSRTKKATPLRSSPRSTLKSSPRSTRGNSRQASELSDPMLNSSQSTIGPQLSQNQGSEMGTGHRTPRSAMLSDPINLSSPLHYGSTDRASQIRSPAGSSSTTFRRRVDIATDSRVVKQISITGSQAAAAGAGGDEPMQVADRSNEAGAGDLVIWGTDVSISKCKQKFRDFLKSTTLDIEDLDIDEVQPNAPSELENRQKGKKAYYLQKLEEIYTLEDPFLNVNCIHVQQFDADLYRQMVSYPQEVIPAFDMAVNEVFQEMYPEANLPHQINTRPYNVARTTSLRSLNPEDINQLITLSGMVIRCSNIIPEMCEAHFECSRCNFSKNVEVDRGRIVEPSVCQHCNLNFSFRLVHNRSMFIDKQQIKLQESPDDMPAGQTPYTVLLYACADLVDAVQPGDRITVTGIYRATPVRMNPRNRNVKSVYRTHIDVVHFRKVDSKRLHDESKEFQFSADRVDALKSLSRKSDIYEQLAHAIAPSIYGYQDMKKGVLLQLFGGSKKDASTMANSKWRHFRSEMNIIICGDPGTSKSQLLKFVHGLVPRGQYTSGKGSSAVGLTAYITKDPDTKQLVLQTGALVLSDGGICCIDEFDKMSDSTRSVLHEVMEQQTLSIAKAGIVCQLNARTSLLCAANPVESQWNKNKTIIDNIQLPHTLLSRFDLIFLLLDPQDESYDRRLARHLVSLYYKSTDEEEEETLSTDLLKDYIAYARNYIHPKLSEEAGQSLIHTYVDMRKVGSGRGQITAYPRQLESLIRIAEAHAKMRLSSTVELVDVDEAIRLHREAIKQAATDPTSGKIDVSILTTGMSASHRKNRAALAQALKSMLQEKRSQTSQDQPQFSFQPIFNDLKLNAGQTRVTYEMFEDAVKDLADEGYLNIVGGKFFRLVL
ncbi:DNA replication licensing factor mcm4-A [Halotydeus destructor]|nr:DNA replication licensing factor mcm4-A [Halotydeus destructor]